MKNPYSLGLRGLALGVAATGLLQTSAVAQFDATISAIEVNQGLQNGNQPLCGDRATFVRVSVDLTNPPFTPLPLDGLMRVYDNGVEVPESPIFSINGPNPMQTSSNLNQINGTLNFYYLPPISSDIVIEVEINPPGPNFVAESNTANNKSTTAVLDFQERAVPEYAYARIDYRPGGGGGFNPPPENLIEPGVGDGFIQGIFPSSDIFYHRADPEYKLWTGNLSGSGTALLNSLQSEWNQMVPKPDFYYGWVPGGLPYNGVSFLNSPVSMGNTQAFKNQRTYAHEIGHNVGRNHVNNQTGWVGIDVEYHLALPASNNLPQVKATNKFDIMVAGLNTVQAWIRPNMYQYVFNHNKYKPGPIASDMPSILVNGAWDTLTGEMRIDHMFAPPQGRPSTPAKPEETAFLVRTYAGDDLLQELPIARGTPADSCADGSAMREIGFKAVLPQPSAAVDRLEIVPVAGVNAQPVTLRRTPNKPQVQFVTPGPDGDVSAGLINVAWNGVDLDGDEVRYYLRYTRNGFHFTPLATGITETSFQVDLRKLPALVNGQGYFQLLASDGLNSTVVNSVKLNGGGNLYAGGSNAPWVYIVTPDAGNNYQKGTTVFLHSSGWDIEDRKLQDPAISWASDIDGPLGNGRIISTANLSVGVHMITVTATDSNALTATDTHLVEITNRELPTVLPSGPVVYCTPGTSASGCQASIAATGTPSATATSGFSLDTTGVEGAKDGLYFFGTNGRQANSWGSGTSFQCVVPPVIRAGLLTGSGTSGACDGTFSQDLNALWCATCPKPLKNPGAGALVQAQLWYRDPMNTSNQTTSLSDAIEFTVQP